MRKLMNSLHPLLLLKITEIVSHFFQIPSFKDMTQLSEVRLDHNKIASLETLTFSGTPNLRVISLTNNRIDKIARNSFYALKGLEFLSLADNSLTTIGKFLFFN